MLQLLKVEWLKIKNYRTFWILAGLYIACIYGINYITYLVQHEILREMKQDGMIKAIIGTPYSFPDVWQQAPYMTGFVLFIMGLGIIIPTTNEFSYKTHRQNIVDGWSRTQFITVKLAMVGIISFVTTLVVIIVALIFGLQEEAPFTFEKFYYIGYFYIEAFTYGCLALLMSILIKRSGLVMAAYFAYAVIIENVLGMYMIHKLKLHGEYLPLNASDALIPFPFFARATDTFLDKPNYTMLYILVVVYIGLFIYLTVRKFQRSDL